MDDGYGNIVKKRSTIYYVYFPDVLSSEGARSDVEGSPSTSIDHSSMLDLTSYNGSTLTVSGVTWAKRGIETMAAVYEDNPDASPLLVKTRRQITGHVIHGGGAFWSTDDADYRAIRRWIAQGSKNN